MLRKLMIGAPLACLLMLPGCKNLDVTSLLPPALTPAPTTDPVVQDARDWANKICGVIPTIGTVASIVATFTGGGAIVDLGRQVGAGICNAITAKGARRGAGPPKYRGVVIRLER